MVYVGSRHGKVALEVGLRMEETVLEEGEALCNLVDEDSIIDPDIAFSYIGEKLQHVLGHFQKDFEGGVSAENLGSKFGAYGSFLPTYQRFPSWSHTNSAPNAHTHSIPKSPKKLQSEDHILPAYRSASPSTRLHDAPRKTMPMGNSLKGVVDLRLRHANESSSQHGAVKKSVNPSDQRNLKVRIKVGSDNLLTQKYAEIYNGLDLVVSPSSPLDETPASSKPLIGNILDLEEDSPISILQTMTTFSGNLLLSPLSEDLIYLMKKRKIGGNGESKLKKMDTEKSRVRLVNGPSSSWSNQKVVQQKKWKPSEKDSFCTEARNNKNSSDQNNPVSVPEKENETEIDTLGCEELVSNALKLPIIANSQFSSPDLIIRTNGDLASSRIADKKHLDTESEHHGLKDECNKVNSGNPHSSEVYSTAASQGASHPGNGPSFEAHTEMTPINDDWVSCDRCQKWRLLPLGTNPKSLPDKWLCRMLTWLPGMNRCSIPEKETTNALRALYHPSNSVQHNQIKIPIGTSVRLPSIKSHNDNKRESHVRSSDAVTNTKTRRKRDFDLDSYRASKKLKKDMHFDDENQPFCKDSVRKRKGKENHGSQSHTKPFSHIHQSSGDFADEMREKKARISESNNQKNGHYLSDSLAEDYLKSHGSLVQASLTADSSSFKVRGSRQNNISAQEVKSSPVELVSSSPLRFYSADKKTSMGKNLTGENNFQDSHFLSGMIPKRCSGGEDDRRNDKSRMMKRHADVCDVLLRHDNQFPCERHSLNQCQIEGKTNAGRSPSSVSQLKKRGKGLASHKQSTRTSGSDPDKEKVEASDSSHDYLGHEHDGEKFKSRRNKFTEESGAPGKAEKFVCKKDTGGETLSKCSKGICHDGQDVSRIKDEKDNLLEEHSNRKLRKTIDQVEVKGNSKSRILPPLARIQTEAVTSLQPLSGSQKENGEKGAFDSDDALMASKPSKKSENQSVQPSSIRNPTTKLEKTWVAEVRDSNSYTAINALKEATDLKHLADRLKHSGSSESNGFYFQASLKFLHAASMLESGSREGSKHNDMAHSMDIYSSTAKLCEFCAREYEKLKDMAAAALAYKLAEVAYMRVVYSSHASASRDRNDFQTSLQMFPLGESPSSSASDVDNLNHATTDNSAGLTKVVGSPQVSGSHFITSQNRSGFLRLLNFAQDTSFAMEASKKSRNAFAAACSEVGETLDKDGINSLKKALDFNFHDVQGLLRLVRVAMEALSH